MSYGTITITTSPTLIVGPTSFRNSIIMSNVGSQPVYIGPDDSITTADGMPLYESAYWNHDTGGTKSYMGPYYGIVVSGTGEVRYWERTDRR